jgi:hypothetical protein
MVRFINCFEVPEGREDEFMHVFAEVNAWAKASRPEWSFFTSTPALYDIVDERTQS